MLALCGNASWLAAQEAAPQSSGTISCSQRLRLARATYEAGRLHELVGTILGDDAKGCFFGTDVNNAFSKQEKVDALKLITLAYIYLEEPEKADASMLQLLKTDHFYDPDENADPAEYLALYNTFRTHPILSYGLKVGATATFAHLLKNYAVGGQALGQGKYLPGYSVVGGAFVERELFPNATKKVLPNLVALAEVFVHLRPNKITSGQLYINPKTGESSGQAEFKAKSTWLDLNLILRYRLNKDHKFDPYIGIGPSISYLLGYNWDLPQTQPLDNNGQIESTVTGRATDVKSAYNKITNSITVMGGGRVRLGEFYFNVEARYQYGLYNIVNPKNRFVEELVMKYATSINDYRQSNFVINVGATIPQFVPKKKKKKK